MKKILALLLAAALLLLTGWLDWHEAVIEHIPCESGELTAGVYIYSPKGGWGFLDDVLLTAEE